MSAFDPKRTYQILARPELPQGAERLNHRWVGGVIEPRRPLCGFTGPRIYVITRNLMTC
jgi:hypothetical protein